MTALVGGESGIERLVRILKDDLHLPRTRDPRGFRRTIPAVGQITRPASGASRPAMIRAAVDFPEPDSPTSADALARTQAEVEVAQCDELPSAARVAFSSPSDPQDLRSNRHPDSRRRMDPRGPR